MRRGICTWRSRTPGEILLEQHTRKHGGIGLRTWSADDDGKLKYFYKTKNRYKFLSPPEFTERFELNFPAKRYYRARLVE